LDRTAKHDLAREIVRDGNTRVLHIGDHDPSGVHVFSSLEEDVTAFVEARGGLVDFRRLAVTPAQIAELDIPTAPAKATDRRSFTGVGDDPSATVQCEAIPPDALARIVENAIREHMDLTMYEAIVAEETLERESCVRQVLQIDHGLR
jgi:hypothetical protein